jgi:hypothetical protein
VLKLLNKNPLGLHYGHEIVTRFGFQIPKLTDDDRCPVKSPQIWERVLPVTHKLAATEYHLKNYLRIENEKMELFGKGDAGNHVEELELIFELEAFLVQMKSSLDMLIKIMDSLIGKGRTKTHTFSDSGNQLIKGLTQYKKQKGVNEAAVDALINLTQTAQTEWLGDAIRARDEINHVRGLTYHYLEWDSEHQIIKKSQYQGGDAYEFMRDIANRNIEFQQDFICHALALCMPPPTTLVRLNGPSNVPNIRWSWSSPS